MIRPKGVVLEQFQWFSEVNPNLKLNHCSPRHSLVRCCSTTFGQLAGIKIFQALLPDCNFYFQNHPSATPSHSQSPKRCSDQQNTFNRQALAIFVFAMPRNRKKPVYNPRKTQEALARRVTPASYELPKRGDSHILAQPYPSKQRITSPKMQKSYHDVD